MALTGLFAYSGGPLARAAPETKLIAMVFLNAVVFGGRTPVVISTLFPIAAVYATLRPDIREVTRDASVALSIGALAAIVAIVDPHRPAWVNTAAIPTAIDFCARLALSFLCCRSFYGTTRKSEIRDGVTRLTRIFLKRADPGFYLALVIITVPSVFEMWTSVRDAARVRGLVGRRLFSVASLALARSVLVSSVQTADALHARAHSSARTVPSFCPCRIDGLIVATCGAIAAIAAF